MWSAGCSTGEERYTLAMLVVDQGLTHDPAWDVLLVGTDVNRESLRLAREGRYAARSFRATPDETRERYFNAHGPRMAADSANPADDALRVDESGRRSAHPADLDSISSCAATSRFTSTTWPRSGSMPRSFGALSLGGWLMLGPSDTVPADRSELERSTRTTPFCGGASRR